MSFTDDESILITHRYCCYRTDTVDITHLIALSWCAEVSLLFIQCYNQYSLLKSYFHAKSDHYLVIRISYTEWPLFGYQELEANSLSSDRQWFVCRNFSERLCAVKQFIFHVFSAFLNSVKCSYLMHWLGSGHSGVFWWARLKLQTRALSVHYWLINSFTFKSLLMTASIAALWYDISETVATNIVKLFSFKHRTIS